MIELCLTASNTWRLLSLPERHYYSLVYSAYHCLLLFFLLLAWVIFKHQMFLKCSQRWIRSFKRSWAWGMSCLLLLLLKSKTHPEGNMKCSPLDGDMKSGFRAPAPSHSGFKWANKVHTFYFGVITQHCKLKTSFQQYLTLHFKKNLKRFLVVFAGLKPWTLSPAGRQDSKFERQEQGAQK